MSNLTTALQELTETADELWQEYLRVGPGAMNDDAMKPFDQQLLVTNQLIAESPIDSTDEWRVRYEKAIADLEPLLKRCVERTEGLSFVTGEAGLIPRKDQHAICESSIALLRELASRL